MSYDVVREEWGQVKRSNEMFNQLFTMATMIFPMICLETTFPPILHSQAAQSHVYDSESFRFGASQ